MWGWSSQPPTVVIRAVVDGDVYQHEETGEEVADDTAYAMGCKNIETVVIAEEELELRRKVEPRSRRAPRQVRRRSPSRGRSRRGQQ
jgi:hypothetical protein